MLRVAVALGRPGAATSAAAARRLVPTATSGHRRMAAAASPGSVPTGPAGGYNDPEECGIADESERQLQEDRQAAQRLAAQGGVGELSKGELASAIAGESREAAAEQDEDAGDTSQVKGDTLTDRAVLEGKEGPGHTTSV
ncbi:hypothetical protein ABPG75_003717 [Micractinium tetrahymenae]